MTATRVPHWRVESPLMSWWRLACQLHLGTARGLSLPPRSRMAVRRAPWRPCPPPVVDLPRPSGTINSKRCCPELCKRTISLLPMHSRRLAKPLRRTIVDAAGKLLSCLPARMLVSSWLLHKVYMAVVKFPWAWCSADVQPSTHPCCLVWVVNSLFMYSPRETFAAPSTMSMTCTCCCTWSPPDSKCKQILSQSCETIKMIFVKGSLDII